MIHRGIHRLPTDTASTTTLYVIGVFCGKDYKIEEQTSNNAKVTCQNCIKIMIAQGLIQEALKKEKTNADQ